MSDDKDTKQEHELVEERAYQGERPTPMTDGGDAVSVGDVFHGAYKGERPSPRPVSEKPSDEDTNDES